MVSDSNSSADPDKDRLSQIETSWECIFEAHDESSQIANPARRELVLRYRGAVYRYVLKMVGSADLAEELCQEFAVKLMNGEFHGADPDRGRFRSYVKTVAINLKNKHFRERATQPGALPELVARPDFPSDEAEFDSHWREEVIHQVMIALQANNSTYHGLLRLRLDDPASSSRELAEKYTAEYGRPMTPENVRQTLKRAHQKFADLVIAEVAASLDSPDAERLRAELKELDLLKYCRLALERWTAKKKA